MISLDFSLLATPEGKKELAQTLIKAVREYGFFYVKNFNISQERVNRQYAIGKRLYDLPLEEKLKYVPEGLGRSSLDIQTKSRAHIYYAKDNGQFNGYVPAGRRM